MSMLQRFFPSKRALTLFISGLLVLLLVPALLLVRPGSPAKASGGGCFNGSPSPSIFPTTASPGTSINVLGFCYPTNVTVKIFFQTTSNGVVTAVTDQGGFFSASLTIPSTYVPGNKYFVHINSATFSVKMLFTFTKPSITVSGGFGFSGGGGGSPAFGSPVTVNGSGFAVGETVDLVWNDSVSGMMSAGLAVPDSSGFFFTSLNSMPSFPAGSLLKLVATGRISALSASTLVHETAAVFDRPTMGVVGTTVKLNGGGFGSNESVQILFQNALVATATTGLQGDFTTSFIVPTTAKIGFGFNNIVASGKTSGVAATTSFSVEPNVSISPNSGFSGTLITVKGGHFTPNGFADILWVFPNGGSGGSGGGDQFITRVPVSSGGRFNTTIFAPQGLISGVKYFVLVIDEPTGGSNQARFLAL